LDILETLPEAQRVQHYGFLGFGMDIAAPC